VNNLAQNKNSNQNYYITGMIIVAIIVLDQITKYLVKTSMSLYESFNLLGNFFKLTYIENSGMAFGIQLGNKFVFTILSILAVFVVVYYLIQSLKGHLLMSIALSLILGGAIGNLIDRILYGRVVDFLDFEFFDVIIPKFKILFINFPGYQLDRWPIFNIADSSVTCGMVLVAIIVFFIKDKPKQEAVKSI
jgi:signal peptidase II